jgi:hypothetical protein
MDPILAAPGPVRGGPVDIIEGFSVLPVAPDVRSPVTAVTPDGQTHVGYVRGEYGWPAVGTLGEDDAVDLPGEQTSTQAVAMVASADGTLHLAWDADRRIRYVRRYPDGHFSEPVLLGEEPSREPNLALTRAGEVVVVWTHDTPPMDDVRTSPRVMVAEGAGEPVAFGAPRIVNPSCCVNEFGDPADRMSGASLAIGPDDAVHVVYEWSSWSNTTIDYVREEGAGFSAPVQISNAAFIPCPALMVDEDGAHITYLRELEPSVFYRNVVDGVAGEEIAVYTPEVGRVTMTMSVRDPEGVLHMGVTEEGATAVLSYMRLDDVHAPAEVTPIVEMEELGSRLELTPRAGGVLLTPDGRTLFTYLRMPGGEAQPWAELASGR